MIVDCFSFLYLNCDTFLQCKTIIINSLSLPLISNYHGLNANVLKPLYNSQQWALYFLQISTPNTLKLCCLQCSLLPIAKHVSCNWTFCRFHGLLSRISEKLTATKIIQLWRKSVRFGYALSKIAAFALGSVYPSDWFVHWYCNLVAWLGFYRAPNWAFRISNFSNVNVGFFVAD